MDLYLDLLKAIARDECFAMENYGLPLGVVDLDITTIKKYEVQKIIEEIDGK